jgi:hypothetical protein
MWIVKLALRRPYTFVVMALLILLLGISAIKTTPTDIFPEIDIPVVTVLWQYSTTLRGRATLRRYSISNEGARITSRVVLENLADAQWPASSGRRYLQVLGTQNQLSPYVDS